MMVMMRMMMMMKVEELMNSFTVVVRPGKKG